MKSTFASVPTIRLNPVRRTRLNRIRLNVDVAGLYLVKISFLLGALLPGWLPFVLGIYNVAAYVTVLSVDPSRLPEAGTTRWHQRQAWGLLLRLTPALAAAVGLFVWGLGLEVGIPTALPAPGFLVMCYTDELLFRNILQPVLRRIGLTRWGAIIGQTLLFTLPYAVSGQSVGAVAAMALLGLTNGYIVYRHRSLWPAFALALLVRTICIGG